ncbi:MAG: helicase C-terminal domain-containing protein, partial [Planctomycetota bacterium]
KDFGHLTHGYCVTSHAAQGRTVDHLILAQSSDSAGAADRKQFYTSVTRGRKAVTIFTDDTNRLLKSVLRDRSRVSATELVGGPPPPLPGRQLSHSRNQQRSLALFASVRRGSRIRTALNARLERVRGRRRAKQRQRGGPERGLGRER